MKIVCIGRNYADHAKEMGSEVPTEPVIFMKPDSALLRNNAPFFIPEWSENIHYETELVVKINRLGKNISEKFAHKYYDEIGLGVDFTARDIQQKLKEKGLPWERAKAFDGSAVIGEYFINKAEFHDLSNIDFRLEINGEEKQHGNTKDMLSNIDKLIAEVSKYFTLKIGDLIYTGTPVGVGPVKINDELKGYIENQCLFNFKVK